MVTVTYNSATDLAACWSRDIAASGSRWLVVDNASTDDSVDVARALGADVVRLPTNVGFGAANNIGLAEVDTPWTMFVNPDVRVHVNDLERLARVSEGNGGALVAPQLLNPDGTPQHNARGLPFLASKVANRMVRRTALDRAYIRDGLVHPTFAAWVMGAAVGGPTKAFEELGGWDDSYFVYYEDHDLGLRSWRSGRPVVVDPQVRWTHVWQRATTRFSWTPWRHELRSMRVFYRSYPHLLTRRRLGRSADLLQLRSRLWEPAAVDTVVDEPAESSARLVCVSPHVPFAGIDHAGGDYLLAYLTAAHEAGWTVVAIVPDTTANRQHLASAPSWLKVVLGPSDEPSPGRRAARLVRTGVSSLPARAWYARLSPEGRSELASASVIDLQWMSCLSYAPFLRGVHPRTPIVGTPHDVKSESVARARRSPSIAVALTAWLSLPAVRRTELSSVSACDRVFVFKSEDIAALAGRRPQVEVRTTPPLVRLPADPPAPDPATSRLIFTAAFWREENDEAARWFLDRVWPIIVRARPGTRIRFAGARPSEWLQSRRSDTVEVTGYLDDLLDAYRGCTVVVAPLRRGAGLKFKVAQALAMGYPVVGTTVAMEGIETLTGSTSVRGHDDEESFAAAVISTLTHIDRCLDEAATEAAMVRHALDFDAKIRQQLEGYAELVTGTR